MQRRIRRIVLLTGTLLVVLLPYACHAEAFIVDDVSRITGIGKITILPVVTLADLPEGRETKIMDQVRRQLALELALKGYTLKRAKAFSQDREISPTEVTAMTPDELALLGPADATHILILFFNALEDSFIVIADSSKARLAAILIDKTNSEVLWKNEVDRGFTSSWFNVGFVGMLVINEDEAAIWGAFKALFKDFPERPM